MGLEGERKKSSPYLFNSTTFPVRGRLKMGKVGNLNYSNLLNWNHSIDNR
jgi:hypothetical protein